MSGLLRALFSNLKQVLWALFLVYIILAVTVYLFGKQIGFYHAFLVCLAIAALVTVTFIALYLLSVLWAAAELRKEKQLHDPRRK